MRLTSLCPEDGDGWLLGARVGLAWNEMSEMTSDVLRASCLTTEDSRGLVKLGLKVLLSPVRSFHEVSDRFHSNDDYRALAKNPVSQL